MLQKSQNLPRFDSSSLSSLSLGRKRLAFGDFIIENDKENETSKNKWLKKHHYAKHKISYY